MFGAVLVLGVYVLFELIMGDYFQSWTPLMAAAFILILLRLPPLLPGRSIHRGLIIPARPTTMALPRS